MLLSSLFASTSSVYAVAIASIAIATLILGRWFDRFGMITLAIAVLVAALFAPLTFLGSPPLALLGMALWGIGMSAQESIMKATVAAMVPAHQRGSAFGIFYLCYGMAWFASNICRKFLVARTSWHLQSSKNRHCTCTLLDRIFAPTLHFIAKDS